MLSYQILKQAVAKVACPVSLEQIMGSLGRAKRLLVHTGLGLLVCAPAQSQAANILWDGAGDNTTWSDGANWFEVVAGTDGTPATTDAVWFGASATFEGNSTPGLTSLAPVINLTADQTIASLNIAVTPPADTNGGGLAAVSADVKFNNGGNSYQLTVGALSVARGPNGNTSIPHLGTLTIGNGIDPNQTLNVTGSALVGSLRNTVGTLKVQNGGTLNLGSGSSRVGLTIGAQLSGTNTPSEGIVEATGGVFSAYLSGLSMGTNASTTSTNPLNLGKGTLDLSAITLGIGGNTLDVNSATLASATSNGSSQQAFVNLGEGTARFGAVTLGRPNAALGALLTQAEMNLGGTILTVDGGGVVINGTGTINVTASGDSAGLDFAAGVPLTINGGELNITFEDTTLPPGDVFWGMRAVGDRVTEFQSLAGLNIIDNALFGNPTIFLDNGFTYVGFAVPSVPEPSTFALLGLGVLGMATRRRRLRKTKS